MSDRTAMESKNGPRTSSDLRRLFRPLNVVLLVAVIGGIAAAAIMQAGPSEEPRPRMMISPPPADPAAPATAAAPPPIVNPTGLEGLTQGSALPLFKTNPPTAGLPEPGPGTRVPVNDKDLFSGKPVPYGAPTRTYRGYAIGFCCANSAGLQGGWEGLTDAEKDTYVRSFLK